MASFGDFLFAPDWGVIPKCPYCSATNIQRRAKKQKTCGADRCKVQLGMEAQRRRERTKKVARRPGGDPAKEYVRL